MLLISADGKEAHPSVGIRDVPQEHVTEPLATLRPVRDAVVPE